MHLAIESAMQNVENGNQLVQQHDSDEDSLFGSPPASPLLRGRSPSPELALPSANNATKNVGTIALPGSQHCSELPVNPLALSMSHGASAQPTPRPPATTRRSGTRSASPSTSTSQVSSRASSAAPKQRPRKKPTKKAVSSPRAPPPEIPLPDPSEPVPANFLRSQTALLGTAGLVAGIKPRNLATNLHTRGSKASHPIVIHDSGAQREIQKEVERPILSRKAFSHLSNASTLDLSSLPLPSNREVVALLGRQRDFFITLESILKLVASGAGIAPQRSSFRSSTPAFRQAQPSQITYSFQPSTKRRRLDRVPAGAVDWDVPYPFAQGEGPEEYRANWERERLKQLISQLTSMIRDATRKIAMRKYLKEQEAKAKAAQARQLAFQSTVSPSDCQQPNHFLPASTIPPNGPNHGSLAANHDVTNLAVQVSNSDRPTPFGSSPTTAFDQLISSLVSATPGQTSSASAGPSSSSPSVPTLTNFDFYPSAASPAPLSSDDFDNWLSILQTFPVNDFDPNQIPNTPLSTEEDFGFIDSILDFDSSAYSSQAAGTSAEASLEELLAQAGANPAPQSGCNAMIIDPVLLAMSGTQFSSTTQTPATFSAASPVPSITSTGTIESMDPATPSSENWETSHPEVYTGGENRDDQEHSIFGRNGSGLSAQGMWGHAIRNSMRTQVVGQGVYDNQGEEIQHLGSVPPKALLDKGKGRDTSQISTSTFGVSYASIYAAQTPTPNPPVMGPPLGNVPQPQQASLATSSSTSSTNVIKSTSKAPNKADILRRANERRKQLTDEIIKVKTQLWETTIEQGILVHMSREYSKNSNDTR